MSLMQARVAMQHGAAHGSLAAKKAMRRVSITLLTNIPTAAADRAGAERNIPQYNAI